MILSVSVHASDSVTLSVSVHVSDIVILSVSAYVSDIVIPSVSVHVSDIVILSVSVHVSFVPWWCTLQMTRGESFNRLFAVMFVLFYDTYTKAALT